MRIYVNSTANLGDFLNCMPVLSGISKSLNTKIDLFIRSEMNKFNGILDFLRYQSIFSSVEFDIHATNVPVYLLSSWTREDKNAVIRPTETCRYENYFKDTYNIQFDVDDEFILQTPDFNIEIKDNYYVGDRWSLHNYDARRKANTLQYLADFNFLDYTESLLLNAYVIKNLTKPFITSITGVAVLSDLLNVESYIVWKPEDWSAEYRVGDDEISWDGGKNISQVFEKHFYLNRKCKLVKEKELLNILK